MKLKILCDHKFLVIEKKLICDLTLVALIIISNYFVLEFFYYLPL